MQLSEANDVKIYNLSAGKSLPQWMEEKEKKKKEGKNHERKGIQLLQDFGMPVVSDKIKVSRDGNYLIATGTYKPRMRCYEVEQMGMKFERCFDSEAVDFALLESDYSKAVFLHCDRYVEVHAQFGKYYRFRIPHMGRAVEYGPRSCDAYFVGEGSQVSRLNLEQGRFLNPFALNAPGANACAVNPEHQLLVVGTVDGTVEAWDPRSKQRVAELDCIGALDLEEEAVKEVSSLAFRDGLTLGVGTSTGHVMLYDIRSSKPTLVKDHMYGVPIKKMVFHDTMDQVLSLDAKCIKIWSRETGKAYTSIESDVELNDLAVYPNSGLLLMSCEQPTMQVQFLPSLGPAPAWCSFLDNLTEELEEKTVAEVFDDYKFVTKDKIVDMGLEHLIGTPLLRAYMHGYFMDVRLYRKAESLNVPTTTLSESRVRKEMEERRRKRVEKKDRLPAVNKDVFLKLKDREDRGKKDSAGLLQDDRFKDMFSDERFQVDTEEDAYKLLNPVLSKLDEAKAKKLKAKFEEVEEDDEMSEDGKESDDFLSESEEEDDDDESSSEDDEQLGKNLKKQFKNIKKEKERVKQQERAAGSMKFYELKEGFTTSSKTVKKNKASLEDRLGQEGAGYTKRADGGHQMVFARKKSKSQIKQELMNKAHQAERQAVRRATGRLKHKKKGFN